MFKKPVVTVGFGLAALCLATAAMANDGNYYSYTEAPVPLATPSPYADTDAGVVIGIGGGYANTHWDNINIPGITSIKDTGFAGQVFLGYDFNKFFGLQAGYVYLPKATANFGGSAKNYVVDLLAKLSLPVTGGFSIYALAGGSYFNSSTDSSPFSAFYGDTSRSHVGPAFGVGASYEFIPNLAIGVDWMRYSGQGKINDSSYQPSPDAVFLNLSYKFPVSFS